MIYLLLSKQGKIIKMVGGSFGRWTQNNNFHTQNAHLTDAAGLSVSEGARRRPAISQINVHRFSRATRVLVALCTTTNTSGNLIGILAFILAEDT
jgi:hypothetical protein